MSLPSVSESDTYVIIVFTLVYLVQLGLDPPFEELKSPIDNVSRIDRKLFSGKTRVVVSKSTHFVWKSLSFVQSLPCKHFI